jgi:hypothetical protein
MPVEQAASLVEHAWNNYQQGRIGRVTAELPKLITLAQEVEDAATADDRRGWAVSARTHHLAATTLSKVGEADLAWIAAERAMYAADQSDDPLVLASAARLVPTLCWCLGDSTTRSSLAIRRRSGCAPNWPTTTLQR